MQKVVEFKKMNFWSSQVDMTALNERIALYNQAGWRIAQVVPNAGFSGRIFSYTLLLEK